MMKVKKSEIPADSLTVKYFPADYKDSFRVISSENISIAPDDLMVRFWTDMPGWVNVLFKLRNFLMRFVGLKGAEGDSLEEFKHCIRNGGKYHFIEMLAKDERETVMLMKDKHLDAYISVRIDGSKSVYVNTLVKYNNRLGKVYFFVIRPIHGLVVRSSLKRAIKSARSEMN